MNTQTVVSNDCAPVLSARAKQSQRKALAHSLTSAVWPIPRAFSIENAATSCVITLPIIARSKPNIFLNLSKTLRNTERKFFNKFILNNSENSLHRLCVLRCSYGGNLL